MCFFVLYSVLKVRSPPRGETAVAVAPVGALLPVPHVGRSCRPCGANGHLRAWSGSCQLGELRVPGAAGDEDQPTGAVQAFPNRGGVSFVSAWSRRPPGTPGQVRAPPGPRRSSACPAVAPRSARGAGGRRPPRLPRPPARRSRRRRPGPGPGGPHPWRSPGSPAG